MDYLEILTMQDGCRHFGTAVITSVILVLCSNSGHATTKTTCKLTTKGSHYDCQDNNTPLTVLGSPKTQWTFTNDLGTAFTISGLKFGDYEVSSSDINASCQPLNQGANCSIQFDSSQVPTTVGTDHQAKLVLQQGLSIPLDYQKIEWELDAPTYASLGSYKIKVNNEGAHEIILDDNNPINIEAHPDEVSVDTDKSTCSAGKKLQASSSCQYVLDIKDKPARQRVTIKTQDSQRHILLRSQEKETIKVTANKIADPGDQWIVNIEPGTGEAIRNLRIKPQKNLDVISNTCNKRHQKDQCQVTFQAGAPGNIDTDRMGEVKIESDDGGPILQTVKENYALQIQNSSRMIKPGSNDIILKNTADQTIRLNDVSVNNRNQKIGEGISLAETNQSSTDSPPSCQFPHALGPGQTCTVTIDAANKSWGTTDLVVTTDNEVNNIDHNIPINIIQPYLALKDGTGGRLIPNTFHVQSGNMLAVPGVTSVYKSWTNTVTPTLKTNFKVHIGPKIDPNNMGGNCYDQDLDTDNSCKLKLGNDSGFVGKTNYLYTKRRRKDDALIPAMRIPTGIIARIRSNFKDNPCSPFTSSPIKNWSRRNILLAVRKDRHIEPGSELAPTDNFKSNYANHSLLETQFITGNSTMWWINGSEREEDFHIDNKDENFKSNTPSTRLTWGRCPLTDIYPGNGELIISIVTPEKALSKGIFYYSSDGYDIEFWAKGREEFRSGWGDKFNTKINVVGSLVVGGNFTFVRSSDGRIANSTAIARYGPVPDPDNPGSYTDTFKWTPLATLSFSSTINTIQIENNMFVGGQFTGIGNTVHQDSNNKAHNIASYDGAEWSSLNGGVTNNSDNAEPAVVNAIAIKAEPPPLRSSGRPPQASIVYVGGEFDNAGDVDSDQLNLAYIIYSWGVFVPLRSTSWAKIENDLNGPVKALVFDSSADRLFVGGDFVGGATYAEDPTDNPVNTKTTALQALEGHKHPIVEALVQDKQNNNVIAGGEFKVCNDSGDICRQGLAKIDLDNLDKGWQPLAPQATHYPQFASINQRKVKSLHIDTQTSDDQNKLYVGGNFQCHGCQASGQIFHMAKLTLDSSSSRQWQYPFKNNIENGAVKAILTSKDNIFFGGNFTTLHQETNQVTDQLAMWPKNQNNTQLKAVRDDDYHANISERDKIIDYGSINAMGFMVNSLSAHQP